MKKPSLFRRAFTIIEILGAAALITTLALVSVISVKDSVSAGQRATMQKELQALNTALNNFKGAGGVIDPDASVSDALGSLQAGTSIGGATVYAPLSGAPPFEASIGGMPYSLSYDADAGFSYIPAGSEIGEVLGDSGRGTGARSPSSS